jgi:Glycosyltransferase family 87
VNLAARRAIPVVLLLGFAAQLAVALTTGSRNDVISIEIVLHALRRHPLHVYTLANGTHFPNWPYPGGYLPVILAVGWLADLVHIAFGHLIRAVDVCAVVALAWIAQSHLRIAGAPDRKRLAAAALIVLGPAFFAWSAYWGQIDPVAILPALLAVVLWDRLERQHRAVICGLLIGLGASFKTVPGLMLFALLPTVESPREAAGLVASAIAVPLLLSSPFLIADTHGALVPLRYHGGPGAGGISMLVEPRLARNAIELSPARRLSGISSALSHHGSVLTLVALAALAVVLWRSRVSAACAAVILWLGLYVFGVNWLGNYIIWAIPFLVVAGYLRAALLVQLLLLAPTVILLTGYTGGFGRSGPATWIVVAYALLMAAFWAACLAAFAVLMRQTASRPPTGPTSGEPVATSRAATTSAATAAAHTPTITGT